MGNFGVYDVLWIGCSLWILFVNFVCGMGCVMESFGYLFEWMVMCGVLLYYECYFCEYVMFDFDCCYGLLFELLYFKGEVLVEYLVLMMLCYCVGWCCCIVDGYVVSGGNVYFMFNGCFDYDFDGVGFVFFMIESWCELG